MKILVPIKRVVDPYVKVRIKSDKTGVETAQVKMVINPFDEIALEEALRIREAKGEGEVVVVTIGAEICQETLRQALALGADRAIHIVSDILPCSFDVAQILLKVVLEEAPHLVIMGKQSIDGDSNQAPQMLAALLDWPQGMYISRLTFKSADTIEVVREIDGGLETLDIDLPAVLSTDLRLNEPRYASLPNIMKAKQKPLIKKGIADYNVVLKPHTRIISVTEPPVRQAGVKLQSAQELAELLRQI